MTQSTLTVADLAQFTGGDTIYRHRLTGLKYSEGVQYLAEKAGAYWLLDKIAILTRHEPLLKVERDDFAVWKLKVKGTKAILECSDGNDADLWHELIDFTDFPLETITIWREGDTFLLPSEH